MPGPALRILIVAAVSILALIGLVVRESLARDAGTEVILKMETVDPRALLTGHYVTVSLQETLPAGQACPPGTDATPPAPFTTSPGHDRWIALAKRGDHASVAGAAVLRAQAAAFGPIVVRGQAACTPPFTATADEPGRPASVGLDLGVTRFHVSQAEGERIDALLAARRGGQDSPVSAIVSIGADGKARMKGLVVEGRRLELTLF